MKKRIAFAVFTTTNSGKDYMVKGNFGSNKEAAEEWATENRHEVKWVHQCFADGGESDEELPCYPNGLFIKKIDY